MDNERTQDYTTTELAAAAGVSDRYIRQLVTAGELTATKYGKTWVIPADVGREWLRQRQERWSKF